MKKEKILISACLVGENVRYDGGHNDISSDDFIQELLRDKLLISFALKLKVD